MFEKIKGAFGKLNPGVVSPIVVAVIGLVLAIFPELTNRTVFVLLGAALLIAGVASLIRYLTLEGRAAIDSNRLATGLILVALGLLVIIRADSFVALLPLAFGLMVFAGGVFKFQRALNLRTLGAGKWYLELIVALLCLVAGIVVIVNPFSTAVTLTRIVGILLVVESVGGGITARIFQKRYDQSVLEADFVDEDK